MGGLQKANTSDWIGSLHHRVRPNRWAQGICKRAHARSKYGGRVDCDVRSERIVCGVEGWLFWAEAVRHVCVSTYVALPCILGESLPRMKLIKYIRPGLYHAAAQLLAWLL